MQRLTIIAIAVIAYAGLNICHEIIGHCGMAALIGTKCSLISSTHIPLITQPPTGKYNIIVVAGSAANWTAGLICLGLLRNLSTRPSVRYFLWLFMCVSLLLPSAYMTVAPVIKFGDAYILISNLPGQLFWRSAVALVGATFCWLTFRLCRAELGRLIGFGGDAARSVAWSLILPAYVTGGILWVSSGLFSQLPMKWAQLQAAGGTFGLTCLLLLLPLRIPGLRTPAQHPFELPRSVSWIVAGALTALVFIFVLGPGIPLFSK